MSWLYRLADALRKCEAWSAPSRGIYLPAKSNVASVSSASCIVSGFFEGYWLVEVAIWTSEISALRVGTGAPTMRWVCPLSSSESVSSSRSEFSQYFQEVLMVSLPWIGFRSGGIEIAQAANELRTCSLKSWAKIKSSWSCRSLVKFGPTEAASILMHSKIALSVTAPFLLVENMRKFSVEPKEVTYPLWASDSFTWTIISGIKCLISLVTERAMGPIASNTVL